MFSESEINNCVEYLQKHKQDKIKEILLNLATRRALVIWKQVISQQTAGEKGFISVGWHKVSVDEHTEKSY